MRGACGQSRIYLRQILIWLSREKAWESRVLAEELHVLNGNDALWQTARPLLEVALRLEQNDDTSTWHGWQKRSMQAFLGALPSPCSLVGGVWDTLAATSTQPA